MTDDATTTEELRKRIAGQRFVMLATNDDSGSIVSRPMTVQELDGWTFRFIAQQDNDVVTQSEGRPVNLAVMDGGTYVSLTGTGRVSRDVEEKRALWGRLNEAYAGEPEDPANVILEVTATGGEYWDGGNPVARVLGLAKAAITGDAPEGKHGTASL